MRMSQLDRERVETILNTLWHSYPNLLGDLAIAAVDQEQLSIDACAKLIGAPVDEVERRLLEFRQNGAKFDYDWAVVLDEESNVAKLADSQVAVWEIVREFRKLGSVDRLTEAFPSLPRPELAAALIYAEQNPAEIESQISRYEAMLAKKRSEYPFMR